ncbi:MAG: undecaprenyl-diphosphate phosphatase [Holosporales bacterium]|nr:undecaprenyl-diphosphate phosphatase [Holosporales bacterium]
MKAFDESLQEGVRLIVLGALQGITEFLPVSSSAHLALLPQFLDWQDQGQGIDVFLNIGTLVVLCLYLFREICALAKGAWDIILKRKTHDQVFFWQVIVASLPVIVVGGIIELCFESRPNNPVLLAATTGIFSLLLFLCDRVSQRFVLCRHQGSVVDALIVGCAQVCALVPGASRLGVCLSAMRFLGYTRLEAFRFSMLLSMPSVLGALTLKSVKVFTKGLILPWASIANGSIVAFLCGILVFWGMSHWLKKNGTFTPFVVYRVLLAILLCCARSH